MHSPLRTWIPLTLALASFACESTEDPFAASGDTNVPRDTNVPDTGTAGDDTGTTDTGVGPIVDTCPDDVVFTGQVFADDGDALSPNGGAPRFEPWDASYDAGLAAIAAAAPSDSSTPVTGSWTITDATVVATEYNTEATQRAQRAFWLADGRATVQVFFEVEDEASRPTFSVKVGQRISGTALSLGNYRGMIQVATADGTAWTLGSEGNEVYIRDVDTALTAADAHTLVRATGMVTGVQNPDCGGSKCFEFEYGDGVRTTLRTESQYVEVGGCVTYVGPVRLFEGAPQFDSLNFDWVWTYPVD